MRIPRLLVELLAEAQACGAAALHLLPATAPRVRLQGELRPLERSGPDPEAAPLPAEPLSADELDSIVTALVPADQLETFRRHGQGEFTLTTPENQPLHATVYRSMNQWQVVVLLPESIPAPPAGRR